MGAFDLAEKWRNPVMVLGDGILGQMMEPVVFPERKPSPPMPKDWVTDGAKGRKPRVINTLMLDPEDLFRHNRHLQAKYKEIARNETRFEEYLTDDADYVLVAYGTTSRVCRAAVEMARESGWRIGLMRPVTLWPFPYEALSSLASHVQGFMAVEMSMGQMVEDVRLGVNGKRPVYFYGTAGGIVPTPKSILEELKKSVSSQEGGAAR
jgi:2-oxoglutarate ferredoxin oxidoreductase subunit alpha